MPATVEEAGKAMLEFERHAPGPNPKFVELARAMLSHFPEADSWPNDPLAEARSCEDAVWAFSLPDEDLPQVIRLVVKHATALGLVVYGDQLGMAFLPDGRVLPEHLASQWAELGEYLDKGPKPFSKAQVQKLAAAYLGEALERHGFAPSREAGTKVTTFRRTTSDGVQRIELIVHGYAPDFECVVMCAHRNDQAEAISDALFPNPVDTLYFNVDVFHEPFGETGRIPIKNMEQIRAMVAMVETYGMPVLDTAAAPGGLDRVMNEPELFPFHYGKAYPLRSPNLSQELITLGRFDGLKALIVAWLAHNPKFEERVAAVREVMKLRGDEAHLERLLEHLRQRGR